MRNFSPFGRNPVAIFGTILVVVFLGVSYLYVYRPNNERRIKEQGFRAMQNIDGNIQAKIQNNASLLNNVLSAYINQSMSPRHIQDYVTNISSKNFILTPVQTLDKTKTEKIFRSGSDSIYSIAVDEASQQFNLTLSKRYKTLGYRISMKIGFEQFIKPLLPDNVLFDQYLVFSKGKTVYQTFRSGLSEVIQDSLLNNKNGIKSSDIRTREIGGTTYQMFLQPVSFTAGSDWVIAGLLSNEKYQYEKNQLPSNIVLFMITVALAIIISFPWIKLYQMGSQDRLTIFDGIWSITVAMLLMSLLFFGLFKYNVPFRPNDSSDSKDALAGKILKAFEDEIKAKYKGLTAFDELMASNHTKLQFDIRNVGKEDSLTSFHNEKAEPKSADKNLVHNINQIFQKADFYQIFWIDKHGREQFNWHSENYNVPHGYFGQRNYFKNIIAGRYYLLNGDTKAQYYLDQITSWSMGIFTSVISKKSALSTGDNNLIVALSFKMKSLDRVVLPAGYSFAMIDQNGKVLYHADKNRNLNENLLQEFSRHEELRSCLEAHAQKTFKTAYFGKEYNVEVKPVTGLPYFMVVFSDISFKDTRDMEIYCFTLSMLFVFFAFLVIEMLVVFFVSSNRSVFKKQRFESSWIGPKTSFHQQYISSSMMNSCVMLLLNFVFHWSTFAEFFFILLFSASAITIFLMCLFARRYQNEGKQILYQKKLRTIYVLLVFILIINLLAFKNLEHFFSHFFSFEIGILFLAAIFFVFADGWIAAGKKLAVRYTSITWNYTHSFTLMVLTRLIITSGIPVALFYVMAYNYEQNLVVRYRHYDFARRVLEMKPGADSVYLSRLKNNANAVYIDGSWIDSAGYSTQIPPRVNRYSYEDSVTLSVLNLFRLYQDSSSVRESHLYQSFATDSSFFYNHLFKDALNNKAGTSTYVQTRKPGGYFKLKSSNLNYSLPFVMRPREIFFWMLMLLLLGIFYVVILNIIRKLFALNLPATNVWKAIDDEILLCKDLNKLLFIIGLPGSHKLFYLLDKIGHNQLVQDDGKPFVYDEAKPDNNNVLILDLIQIPDNNDPTSDDNVRWKKLLEDIFSKDYKLILVNHFEYNIKDEFTNRIKLNLLERLMVEDKGKIIILSSVHPTSFLDSLNAQEETTAGKAIQDLERWHVLLGHYRIVIHPLEPKTANIKVPDWEQMIIKETQYTHFLSNMQLAAIQAARSIPQKETTANGDSLAFKLQVTAHYFYMYIWQSLTKEEKFLLYDLAEDGLVNPFDGYNLSMLISKGVIIRSDGTLKLFNRGFRNFILTAIGNTEALKIKNQMQDNGNWNKLKAPLLVVIFAILAFLLTSQQEAYSKLITYVSALAAGIPVFIKLISLFDSGSSQKSS